MGNSVTVWQLAAISMHVLMTTGSQCGRNTKAAAWKQAVLHPCHMEHMDNYHKCMLCESWDGQPHSTISQIP